MADEDAFRAPAAPGIATSTGSARRGGTPSGSGPQAGALPPEAYGAALCTLPGMGPARLMALARAWPALDAAWQRVLSGTAVQDERVAAALGSDGATLPSVWAARARALDPQQVLAAHHAAGIGVTVLGGAAYPEALAADIEPAVVLFHRGRPDVVPGPRVAIVGTRNATRYGCDVAWGLGRDLAAVGVRVVSGLALGIDGAAHEGALAAGAAPPLAVVGSGLDVIYPKRHASLWRRVEQAGVVLSEAPLGAAPEPWRFPSRNRLVAALADVVVVVESPRRGGSMHTVDAALERDVPVLAVPGAVTSPTSAGCNQLLADAVAGVARGADDVLSLLGLSVAAVTRGGPETRPAPTAEQTKILDAFGWQPAALEQLAVRTGLGLGTLAEALQHLEAGGWVAADGGWFERVARPDR